MSTRRHIRSAESFLCSACCGARPRRRAIGGHARKCAPRLVADVHIVFGIDACASERSTGEIWPRLIWRQPPIDQYDERNIDLLSSFDRQGSRRSARVRAAHFGGDDRPHLLRPGRRPVAETPAAMEQHLRGVLDTLVALAIEHGSPAFAEYLRASIKKTRYAKAHVGYLSHRE